MVPSSQLEESESLGAGFERHYEGIKSFQDQLSKYADDLQKLQARCSDLKSQCHQLQQEQFEQQRQFALKEGEMANLNRQIEDSRDERDKLHMELAAMREDERVWRAVGQKGLQEIDEVGRLNRTLWLRDETIKELKERLKSIDDEHQLKIQDAADATEQLKHRIVELEGKPEQVTTASGIPMDAAQKLSDLEHSNVSLREELRRMRQHYEDTQEALLELSKTKRLLEEKIEILEEDKRVALEKTRVAMQEKKVAQNAYAALKKQAENARQSGNENPRALQSISPNISTRSQTSAPSTPTKSQPFDDTNLSQLSPKSKEKAFQHLLSQNASLKKQLDRERSKRASDIKRFQEYKALQDERKALKQRRREERAKADSASRSANATPASSSVPPPSDPPAPVEERSVPPAAPAPEARLPPPRPKHSYPDAASALPEASTEDPPPLRGDSPPNRVRAASTSRITTPTALKRESNTPLRRTTTGVPTPTSAPKTSSRAPSRVTPWLGGTPGSSKTGRRAAEPFDSDDDNGGDITPTAAKQLVRDRTGTTSLLKAALQRTTTVGGPSAVPDEKNEPVTPLSASRKRPLDFENLSPAERAAQRRKLAQMSTAERREFYAQYKGSGRYLRPEEVTRSVADEFEIDPARNNGVAHKYHETVRGRDARRQMHGGDCECCRDYYEAVGPLPRFNQGPAWKRDAVDEEDDLTEHRNRVSRHRETWQRAPTPPDFWKIGFPSTQDVEAMNAKADEMTREREEEVRRQAARKDSKWRRKGKS